MSLIVANCAEQLECWLEIFSDFTHRRQVSTSVAVVRRAPDGRNVLLVKMELISLIDELMRSCDESEIVHMAEFLGDLVSEQPTCSESVNNNQYVVLDIKIHTRSSRTDSPSLHVFRIGPHQVTERPFVGNLLCSSHNANLVQCSDLRT